MNPVVKELWLTALRSGKYKQGLGFLRSSYEGSENLYCCLGVLCDVYIKQGGENATWADGHTAGVAYEEYWSGEGFSVTEDSILPPHIAEWAGIGKNGQLPGTVEITLNGSELTQKFHELTGINDHTGYNFERIADLIEEHL